jgi:hypothetical protein
MLQYDRNKGFRISCSSLNKMISSVPLKNDDCYSISKSAMIDRLKK